MPSSFYCNACKLGFAVGWFHYHGEHEGYGAETWLVCSACGTMHTVMHPSAVWVANWFDLLREKGTTGKLDKLMAQKTPLYLRNSSRRVMEHLSEWQACEVDHPLCPPSKHAFMKDHIALEGVKCFHCARPSTLVKDWTWQNVRCPGCGQPELSRGESWIT